MQQIKLYICPRCNYRTVYRWVLARHLSNIHGYSEKKAKSIALENEYHLNLQYQSRSVGNEISKKGGYYEKSQDSARHFG